LISENAYQHLSDKELLDQYQTSHNTMWLNVLFKRYSLLVYGVCLKYLKNDTNAQDAAQQIFEKCIIELNKYEVSFFKSWLYQITKNYCFMQLRNNKEFSTDNIQQYQQATDNELLQDEKNNILQKEITLEILHECLAQLPLEQKQTVELFFLQKKSYQQISEILNFNYLQVKSYIQNGKRNLKILILKQQEAHKKQ
jgi:RNA polymerase sigma factor (sigma-70 family)